MYLPVEPGRLIEGPVNRGPENRGCTVLCFFSADFHSSLVACRRNPIKCMLDALLRRCYSSTKSSSKSKWLILPNPALTS